MLDGSLNKELIERLNAMERQLFAQIDRLFVHQAEGNDVRMLSHAFFSALNGILISFRNYPGRQKKDVTQHMQKLGRIIAKKFNG